MQFDFEQFTKRFKRAYPVARYGRRKQNDGNDCDLFSYDEALEVFREYFLAYEYYTGTAHPQLKREKIIDIIKKDFTARLKALEDSLTAQDPVAIVEPVPGGYLLKTGTQKGAIVTMNELNKRYDVVIIDDVPRIKESE